MFKKLGITTLALAAALAVAAPTVTLAHDRDDDHSRGVQQFQRFDDHRKPEIRRDRDDRNDRDTRIFQSKLRFEGGVHAAPSRFTPAPVVKNTLQNRSGERRQNER
jgi:hypothetical protein